MSEPVAIRGGIVGRPGARPKCHGDAYKVSLNRPPPENSFAKFRGGISGVPFRVPRHPKPEFACEICISPPKSNISPPKFSPPNGVANVKHREISGAKCHFGAECRGRNISGQRNTFRMRNIHFACEIPSFRMRNPIIAISQCFPMVWQ